DKPAVFREIYRVLKPGGRFAVSDIVLLAELPEQIMNDVSAYVGCVAGASLLHDYVRMPYEAGLDEISIPQIAHGSKLAEAVALCMVVGVAVGKWAPFVVSELRDMEFGRGSQVNLPIAILIWLMIVPMMMKVDFASIRRVGERPQGLLVTLFVNWLVKPFSM